MIKNYKPNTPMVKWLKKKKNSRIIRLSYKSRMRAVRRIEIIQEEEALNTMASQSLTLMKIAATTNIDFALSFFNQFILNIHNRQILLKHHMCTHLFHVLLVFVI